MTDWNDDLQEMFQAQFPGGDKRYKEWLESLSDDQYLDHVLGKLKYPGESEDE